MENKNKNWKISQQKQLKKLEKTVKGLSLALRSLSTWCGEVEHTQYMMLKAFAEDDDIIADTEDMLAAHKERTEAEKVILPKPCDGPLYANCDIVDYLHKVEEEFVEVQAAFEGWKRNCDQKSRDKFLLDCTDLIVATTSLMWKSGAELKERQKLMDAVNFSNGHRDGGRRFQRRA